MNALVAQMMDGNAPSHLHIQTKRVATGNILAAILAPIAITWDAAFADTNYTIGYVNEGAAGVLSLDSIASKTTTGCTINVKNVSLSTASGTLHVTAIHD